MSKRDIITVCTLAAHLAYRAGGQGDEGFDIGPTQCASDAMALQRLGRRASNNAVRLCNIQDYQEKANIQAVRIHARAMGILKPYGLNASVGGDPRGYCLHILGLPGNTLGGDEDGFGI